MLEWIKFGGEIASIIGIIIGVIASVVKIFNAQKCLLRSEMLRIYYKCKDLKQIQQYDLENFILMYDAYKKLRGNSFIDDIYEKVKIYEVVK